MSMPEELRSVTDNTLHGLIADDALKFRILQKAAAEHNRRNGMHALRAVPLLCTVLAALLIIVTALNGLQAVPSSGPGNLISFTAGNDETLTESVFPGHYSPDSVVSIDMDGMTISNPERCSLLASILADKASAGNLSVAAGKKLLTFSFSDGKSISYHTEEPYLIGTDGRCWYCPDFFREFIGLSE